MSRDRRDDDPGALTRAHEQAEKSFGPTSQAAPADDPIERLGKRIGRGLSILLAAALIVYLWHTYIVR
jgi:hypothetical protein